jgi:hypothetical protein
MNTVLSAFAALAIVVGTCDEDVRSQSVATIEGNWRIVSVMSSGRVRSKGRHEYQRISIIGETLSLFTECGAYEGNCATVHKDGGHFEIDITASFVHLKGKHKVYMLDSGLRATGIVSQTENRIVICWEEASDDQIRAIKRPDCFSTSSNDNRILIVAERMR